MPDVAQLSIIGEDPAEAARRRAVAEAERRMRDHEADFTPVGAVHQLFEVVIRGHLLVDRWGRPLPVAPEGSRIHEALPRQVVDVCAGAGPFSMVCRRSLPDSWIAASELREEERENLEQHAHWVDVGDSVAGLRRWHSCTSPARANGSVGLIVGNPAFSLMRHLVEEGYQACREGAWIVLLGLSQWGQAEDASEWLRDYTPECQFRIGGRLKFRVGVNPKSGKPWGHDSREYSWWCWRVSSIRPPADRLPEWRTYQLPMLEPADREWVVKPGTEWRTS